MCLFEEFVVRLGADTGLLFVLDLGMPDAELQGLLETVRATIPLLPRNVHIGLISFDHNIYLHHLNS
jgi:hypothetical protein